MIEILPREACLVMVVAISSTIGGQTKMSEVCEKPLKRLVRLIGP